MIHKLNPTGDLHIAYILANYDSHTGKPKATWMEKSQWIKQLNQTTHQHIKENPLCGNTKLVYPHGEYRITIQRRSINKMKAKV